MTDRDLAAPEWRTWIIALDCQRLNIADAAATRDPAARAYHETQAAAWGQRAKEIETQNAGERT